jgi:hypothetical protein
MSTRDNVAQYLRLGCLAIKYETGNYYYAAKSFYDLVKLSTSSILSLLLIEEGRAASRSPH